MTKRNHYRCVSCDKILTLEKLVGDKLGTDGLDVCLSCLCAALEEVLREEGVLPVKEGAEVAA